MNYRHAFHAGNFADVVKHALLARILAHLCRKDTPFRVIDTHAGIGWYDLSGPEAVRTGEWRDGVGRLDVPLGAAAEDLLAPYRAALAFVRERHGSSVYPGSPALAAATLRPSDRAIVVEKHPDDAALLVERFRRSRIVKPMAGDGWALLPGLVPPKERRGLVLVDPPFEEPGEFARAVDRLRRAVRKWPTGIVAFWYPIKAGTAHESFAADLAAGIAQPWLRLELDGCGASDRPGSLKGSGLAVINPPWTLAAEARCLLPELAGRLGRNGRGTWRVEDASDPAEAGHPTGIGRSASGA